MRPTFLLACAALVLAASKSLMMGQGVDPNYVGPDSGSWGVASNWSPTIVPNGIGDTAFYDGANGNRTVNQNTGGNVTLGTLSLTGSTSATFTVSNANGITMNQDGAGAGFATISNTNTSATITNRLTLSNTANIVLADDLLISNTGNSTGVPIQILNTMTGTGNVTFSNVSTAVASLGAITLTASNIFTGSVLIQRGTVNLTTGSQGFGNVGNSVTLGQAGQGSAALVATAAASDGAIPYNITVVSGSGGTLTLGGIASGGLQTWSGNITLNGNLDARSNSPSGGIGNGVKFSNTISGVGSLTKTGTGNLILSHSNTFTGDMILAPGNGTLTLSNTNALQNSTLNYTGSTLTFDDSAASAFTLGGLTGSANIVLQGTPGGSAIPLTIGNNNTSPAAYNGVLSGTGRLVKVGSGTETLTGANSYTGTTQVNGGRLLINGNQTSATGAVSVSNSGAVLGGTGIIGGPTTVNANAAILGGTGAAATGTLTVANNLTLNSGSIIELALAAGGAHSTLARTAGTWTFNATQAFTFIDLGATAGFYDNIIAGLAANPGSEGSWMITNPGWTGTFTYDGANIDLNLAVPEPSTWLGAALAFGAVVYSQRRRLQKL